MYRLGTTDSRRENLLDVNISSDTYRALETRLRDRQILAVNGRLVDLLNGIVGWITQLNNTTSTDDIIALLYIVWNICNSSPGLLSLVDQHHGAVWQKLSAHADTVLKLMHHVRYLVGKGVAHFHFEQIFATQQPETQQTQGSLMYALNTWTAFSGGHSSIQDFKAVRRAYPEAREGRSGLAYTTFHQHPELSIALHSIRNKLITVSGGKMEIGISKRCCHWCQIWIEIANHQLPDRDIVVRASGGKRGKKLDGWELPRDDTIELVFWEWLSKEVQSLYEACVRESEQMSEQDGYD
ncbi:MAG: hypothetical protein Q9218_004625 [Villophora microphyllina]